MSSILHAAPAVSLLPLANVETIDVFVYGDRFICFISRPTVDSHLPRSFIFPDKQKEDGTHKQNRVDKCESLLSLLADATKAPRCCCGRFGEIAAVVKLHTSVQTPNATVDVTLLFALRCACFMLVTFALDHTAARCVAGRTFATSWTEWPFSDASLDLFSSRSVPIAALVESDARTTRVAVARLAGTVECVEFHFPPNSTNVWPPRLAAVSLGPLRLDGTAVALRWMSSGRDARRFRPLLAALHAPHADPTRHRLTICAVETTGEEGDALDGEVWTAMRGVCAGGPWHVAALTLANPSFLLHASLALHGGGEGAPRVGSAAGMDGREEMDLIGVFLRPPMMAYPVSAWLRRVATRETNAAREFHLVLYNARGEVARCPIGGFVESAVSRSVTPTTSGCHHSHTSLGELIATVLVLRSDGVVLLVELRTNAWNANGTRPTSAGWLRECLAVRSRTVSISAPSPLGRLMTIAWDGRNGNAVFLLTQTTTTTTTKKNVEPTTCCFGTELNTKSAADFFVVEAALHSDSTSTEVLANCTPLQSPELLYIRDLVDKEEPLCRCVLQDGETEIIVTRNGRICCANQSISIPCSSDNCVLKALFEADAADVCVTAVLHRKSPGCRLPLLMLLVPGAAMVLSMESGSVLAQWEWQNEGGNTLYPCALRQMANCGDGVYFIAALSTIPDNTGRRTCRFLLFQLTLPTIALQEESNGESSPIYTLRLTDTHDADSDGHPLFDWNPSMTHATCNDPTVLIMRELLYKDIDGEMRGLMCLLSFDTVNRGKERNGGYVRAYFGSTRRLFPLRRVLPLGHEPTLFQAASIPFGEHVFVVSFTNGAAMAAIVRQNGQWDCQQITAAGSVPFMRLTWMRKSEECGIQKGEENKNVNIPAVSRGCCRLQDARGKWQTLVSHELKEVNTEKEKKRALEWMKELREIADVAFGPKPHACSTCDVPFFVYGDNELFELREDVGKV